MNTLGELLTAACTRHRGRVAIAHGERALTYGQLLDRASRFASSLRALGVAPNDRVAAFLGDGVESVEVFVGCALAGVDCPRRQLPSTLTRLKKSRIRAVASGPFGAT